MKKIILFFFALSVFSCKDQMVEKPEHLIDREVMIDILCDIAVFQAAENADGSKFKEQGIVPNEMIYKKYQIDSVTFAQNDRYYASDPHDYKKMYGEVTKKLEEKLQQIK